MPQLSQIYIFGVFLEDWVPIHIMGFWNFPDFQLLTPFSCYILCLIQQSQHNFLFPTQLLQLSYHGIATTLFYSPAGPFFFPETLKFSLSGYCPVPVLEYVLCLQQRTMSMNSPTFITSYRSKVLNERHLGMYMKVTQHIMIDDPPQIPQLTYFTNFTM